MDEKSRRRMNRLMALVFVCYGLVRFVDYFKSGELPEALAGAGFVLLAFCVYRDRLAPVPGSRASSAVDRIAQVGGYVGLALVGWTIVTALWR